MYRGAPDPRFRRRATMAVFGLLGLSVLGGILLQAPCFSSGWDLPYASYHQCASPMANALGGGAFPVSGGRAAGDLGGFSLVTSWLVALAGLVSGSATAAGTDVAAAMGLLLLFSVLGAVLSGIALVLLAGARSWLPVAFLSPVVALSLGQNVDSLGVAALLWALVLLAPEVLGRRVLPGRPEPVDPGRPRDVGRLSLAAVLLVLACFSHPVALVVLGVVAVMFVQAGQAGRLPVLAGVAAIATGVLVLADGRTIIRLRTWWADLVDRGSIASVLSMREGADPGPWGPVLLAVGVVLVLLCLLGLLVRARPGRVRGRPLGPVGDDHRTRGPIDPWTACTVLMGIILLFLPALPVTAALWLLPFATLAVHRLWVHVPWMLAETALVIAVNLSDVMAFDEAKGLSDKWLVFLTLLRWIVLCGVVVAALFSRPDRRSVVEVGSVAEPAATDSADVAGASAAGLANGGAGDYDGAVCAEPSESPGAGRTDA